MISSRRGPFCSAGRSGGGTRGNAGMSEHGDVGRGSELGQAGAGDLPRASPVQLSPRTIQIAVDKAKARATLDAQVAILRSVGEGVRRGQAEHIADVDVSGEVPRQRAGAASLASEDTGDLGPQGGASVRSVASGRSVERAEAVERTAGSTTVVSTTTSTEVFRTPSLIRKDTLHVSVCGIVPRVPRASGQEMPVCVCSQTTSPVAAMRACPLQGGADMKGTVVLSHGETHIAKVLGRVAAGVLTLRRTSELLGVSHRQASHLKKRYAAGGGPRHLPTGTGAGP